MSKQTTNKIIAFAIMAAMLFAAIFTLKKPSARLHIAKWNSMGTIATISTYNKNILPDIQRIAKTTFDEFEFLLSSWLPDSELNKISSLAGTSTEREISPLVTNVYFSAFEMMRISENTFNPFIKPLMNLWGFSLSPETKEIKKPSPSEIKRLLFTIDDVSLNGNKISLKKKGMRLDLGGIAKGAAIDEALLRIASRFPDDSVIINFGGNIKSQNAKTDKTLIRNPLTNGYISITNEVPENYAIATSGGYERYVVIDGEKVPHILDGRTGYPAKKVTSVSVIAPSATLADALSTTLFIMGEEKGSDFLKSHFPEAQAIWIK